MRSADMFLAAKTGNLVWLEQCFKQHPDPNELNAEGMALIHTAASACQLKSLAALIEKYGANVNQTSIAGLNSLHFALTSLNRKKVVNVVAYLIEKGIDVNCSTPDNWTPLHKAACEGHLTSIELLLLKNANINVKDAAGLYPHDIAKKQAHRGCYRLLHQAFWTYKKDRISLQKFQLGKLTSDYNSLLKDALEQLAAEQDFFGNLTHNNWLESKGIQDANVRVKVQQLGTEYQPRKRMEGLQKKLKNGGIEMKKFVDCSARVESLSSKYKKRKETSTQEVSKKKREKQKVQKASLNSQDSEGFSFPSNFDSVEFGHNTAGAALHIDNVIDEPVTQFLEMFVKVEYSKDKPVALRLSLPGQNDKVITKFPDISAGDIQMSMKGTKDRVNRTCDFDSSILRVEHKRIFPHPIDDTFRHLKHEQGPTRRALSSPSDRSSSTDSTGTSGWSDTMSSAGVLV